MVSPKERKSHFLLAKNNLTVTYVRHCIKTKDFELLKKTLANKQNSVSSYMKTAIKTINKYINYVENTLKYDYNNGILEGINNKIKVIKRISFGYRSFYHFRN
uniref:transposase n=1 Tax=Ureibacillus sp. FSL K6-3587 TaxID=2954681 RepID=UPI00406C4BCF